MTGGFRLAGRATHGTFTLAVDLDVTAGHPVAVVGPNAAGKSTLLSLLAGLVALDSGTLHLGGVVVDDVDSGTCVPPHHRRVGLAPQHPMLFPHLDALDNVAFGPTARGESPDEARAVAARWLERLGVRDPSRKPSALSGGEAQRVALARALATSPDLLLLDEPLSAVDATARPALRGDLAGLLAEHAVAGGTAVVVSHDPVEAAALADDVVVIEGGRVVQRGTPDDLVARPRSAYVADLVGVNRLRGTAAGGVVALDSGAVVATADTVGSGDVVAVVHPRSIALHITPPSGTPRNAWPGTVAGLEPDVGGRRVRVRVGGPVPVVAEVTSAAADELGLRPGQAVWATVKATEVVVHPA